ncbi:MAG: methionine adenosyltransferase [Rhodobacteraceae bacterium]|nr:methionine adenosyltransferase [Paracoccaceae bacterium]
MSRQNYVFTSESVSEGHPDKLCDRISDAVLDYLLGIDPQARVACETFATTGLVVIGGEIGLPDLVEGERVARQGRERLKDHMGRIPEIARDCIKAIGYEQEKFHWNTCHVLNFLHEQSVNIAQGVTGEGGREQGAGDQGIMFGYATDETPELMPAPILYAHAILRRLAEARHAGELPMLGPDAKSQLSVRYADGRPVGVTQIVVSHQHLVKGLSGDDVKAIVRPYVEQVLPDGWLDGAEWHVNPTGEFLIGGPDGDAGLTGRKIIVDTYGGAAPHGGGAFSGKDPTKVDRSAAYAARYLAKNVVAAGLARRCTIQLSYAIGVARPLSIYVDTHGTGEVAEDRIERVLMEGGVMDLTPGGIRAHLKLNRPIYQRTAAYGHFGRRPEIVAVNGSEAETFTWEKTDLAEALRAAL